MNKKYFTLSNSKYLAVEINGNVKFYKEKYLEKGKYIRVNGKSHIKTNFDDLESFSIDGKEFYLFDKKVYTENKIYLHESGYNHIWIGNKDRKASRLTYEIMIGKIQENFHIDHINRIRHDDSLQNLRAVSPSENMLNKDYNTINAKHDYQKYIVTDIENNTMIIGSKKDLISYGFTSGFYSHVDKNTKYKGEFFIGRCND
ncbi:MAG: HNH endonuclease [Fusobacteriaceae bacterium]